MHNDAIDCEQKDNLGDTGSDQPSAMHSFRQNILRVKYISNPPQTL